MLLKSLKEKNKATEKGNGGKNMNLKNFLGKLFTKKKTNKFTQIILWKKFALRIKIEGGGEGKEGNKNDNRQIVSGVLKGKPLHNCWSERRVSIMEKRPENKSLQDRQFCRGNLLNINYKLNAPLNAVLNFRTLLETFQINFLRRYIIVCEKLKLNHEI